MINTERWDCTIADVRARVLPLTFLDDRCVDFEVVDVLNDWFRRHTPSLFLSI